MYAELGDLRGYLDIDATGDDSKLQEAIEDAQTYIESETNRTFEASASTAYYYRRDALNPWARRLLHLDRDCLTVTELLNGDSAATEIVLANYWLLDRNLGPPYHWIELLSNTGIYWEFDPDCWVKVTGTWGHSTTPPDDIRRATLVLASYFYRQKDAAMYETTAIVESGAIAIPQGIPATVDRIIKRYKRHL